MFVFDDIATGHACVFVSFEYQEVFWFLGEAYICATEVDDYALLILSLSSEFSINLRPIACVIFFYGGGLYMRCFLGCDMVICF